MSPQLKSLALLFEFYFQSSWMDTSIQVLKLDFTFF